MDLAVDYVYKMTKGQYRMWGNAKDAINNSFPAGITIHKNTPDFLPQVGDIAVYTLGYFNNAYGHIAIVHSNPTLQSMVVVEQNWDSKANSAAKLRTDYYDGVSHFLRFGNN